MGFIERFYVERNEEDKRYDIVEIVTFETIKTFPLDDFVSAADYCRVLNLADNDHDRYMNELLKICGIKK
jgi:hypothetical protein